MSVESWGAICFGVVVGWITYRTLRRAKASSVTDIGVVVASIAGGAVMKLFVPEGASGRELFGAYAIGLFAGFFGYFAVALVVEKVFKGTTVDTWMMRAIAE